MLYKYAGGVFNGAKTTLVYSPHPAFAVLLSKEFKLTSLSRVSALISHLKSKTLPWVQTAPPWDGPKRIQVTLYLAWRSDARAKAKDDNGAKPFVTILTSVLDFISKQNKRHEPDSTFVIHWVVVPVLEYQIRQSGTWAYSVRTKNIMSKRKKEKGFDLSNVAVRWSGIKGAEGQQHAPRRSYLFLACR